MEDEQTCYKTSSTCLLLFPDDTDDKVKVVEFLRDANDIDAAAATVLGLKKGDGESPHKIWVCCGIHQHLRHLNLAFRGPLSQVIQLL